MRIGFEAKRAFRNFTGLGNYSRAVIKTMAQHFPENQYILYTPKDNTEITKSFLDNFKNISIRKAPFKFLKSFWRTFQISSILKKDKIDLFHGLSHELPLNIKKFNIPSVVTIHDLIYLRFPHYFKFIDRKIYDYKFRSACKNADRIIAISQQTKDDIIKYFKTNPSKIDVVYQGCDPIFYKNYSINNLLRIKETYHLPEKFLLCVGTIEYRKNQLLIVEALRHLNTDIRLVLLGKATSYKQVINDHIILNNLQEQIIFLENVPFKDLPLIYQSAAIFIYPSRFEGFGIPILEALNSAVPVIATMGSCLEEAGGPNSLYVDPDDAIELAKTIEKINNSITLKNTMVEEGKKYALSFREDFIAKKLMAVYQKTLNNV